MNYEEAKQYLFSRHAAGMKLGLENIHKLLERLGHPELACPAIHIAGTNGKGSTAAMMESVLRHAGYKTGLYTSPHLIDMRERILINGQQICEEKVVELTEHIAPHANAVNATFFEILTAMAYCAFRDTYMDIAVLETGLGGRLDATSTAHPIVSIITNIDLDHTHILGSTLEKIAFEKAGILKPGIPCVLGSKEPEVIDFFEFYCNERDIPLHLVRDEVKINSQKNTLFGSTFKARTPNTLYDKIDLSLAGSHQIDNAAACLLAVEQLNKIGWSIEPGHIRAGLKQVHWQGRLQILQKKPVILLDSAHNLAGMQSLVKTLKEHIQNEKITLLLGFLKDKQVEAMAELTAPLANRIFLSQPLNDRAMPVDQLESLPCFQDKFVISDPKIENAFKMAFNATGTKNYLIVTGSLYLVGEVLRLWKRYQNSIKS